MLTPPFCDTAVHQVKYRVCLHTHTHRCFALRLYVDGINAALPRSVGKMTLPEPPYGRVEIPAAASAADSEEE